MDHGLSMYYTLLGTTLDNEAYLNQEIDNRNQTITDLYQEIAALQSNIKELVDKEDWLTQKSRDLIFEKSLEINIQATMLSRYGKLVPEADFSSVRKLYADDPEWLQTHREYTDSLLPKSILEREKSKENERTI
jgi:regulator of replication initiation timing